MSCVRTLVCYICVCLKTCYLIASRRPYKLSLLVSGGCNLRCRICSLWQNQNTRITLREVQELWNGFRTKPCWINLSGGEPTLNDELEAILTFFARMNRSLLVQLTTNGYRDCTPLVARVLQRNRRSLLRVTVSIDGNAAEHDHARGRAGAYDRAWLTYRHLMSLRAHHRQLGVVVGVTISHCNYRSVLPHLRRLVASRVPIGINLANASAFYRNSKRDSFKTLPRSDLVALLRAVQMLIPKLSLDALLQVNFLQSAIAHLEGKPKCFPCSSPVHHVLVDSELRLLDCVTQARPWAPCGQEREQNLQLVRRIVRHPQPRLRVLQTQIDSSHCNRECLTPCDFSVHAVSALMQPFHAARLLGVYLYVCVRSMQHRRRAPRMGSSTTDLMAIPQLTSH